jgi:hypothetical protein
MKRDEGIHCREIESLSSAQNVRSQMHLPITHVKSASKSLPTIQIMGIDDQDDHADRIDSEL